MTSRKDFLAATSLLALAPVLADAATPAPKPKSSPQPALTFDFDRSGFEQILAKPAKHKQCFGAMKLAGGGVLEAMNNSIDAYDVFLKEGAGAMQAVAVLYHGSSISLAMSDSVWNELLIPALPHAPGSVKKDMGSVKPGAGNPYLRSARKDPNDVSVESLTAKGSTFFVCHNAIAGFSELVAQALKMPLASAHRRIMAGIVPGALVVPAGVMAVNACQEARFTYIAT